MFKSFVYFKEIAKARFQLIKYVKAVQSLKKSDWFDAGFYKNHYPDVCETGIDPYFHYLFFGRYESRAASEDYYQDFDISEPYRYKPVRPARIKNGIGQLKAKSFFSALLYVPKDTSVDEVNQTVRSIQKQVYPHFELMVGFDQDAFSVGAGENQKVKTVSNCDGYQSLLEAASGDYIAVTTCGERLTQDALFEAAKRISEQPDTELIYADEDEINAHGRYHHPHFKTDFNYQLLLSYPYMGNFVVFNKVLLERIEKPFDSVFKKAMVYDACLKAAEKSGHTAHIPKVLNHIPARRGVQDAPYRLRTVEDEDFCRAVQNHLVRTGQKAQVERGGIPGAYRVKYAPDTMPKVSIIIPFKDHPELLETCVGSILDKTEYPNFEIVLVSNNSQDDATFSLLEALKKRDGRIVTCEYNKPFNFSAINNFAVEKSATGDCFLFLNNDTEIITKGWLKTMVGFAVQTRIGAVTAKLLYANHTVQSAGIGISEIGEIIEYHKFFKADHPGYFGRLALTQDIGAVSGACLMVEKSKFFEVGGFDEAGFPVTYNDIDLCYRLRQNGYVSVLVPDVSLYHYESTTRAQVFDRSASPEYRELMRRYGEQIEKGDPYYNPNFKQKGEKFEIK